MNAPIVRPASDDDIARLAHAIWESEGRPEGRDREHWQRAREIIERGEPGPGADSAGEPAARPVQPGFEDVPPGTVPDMDKAAAGEIHEEPGGRFAKELAELPETSPGAASETPGPRNPQPIPPAGPEGYTAVPSVADNAAGSRSDDPAPPPAGGGNRKKSAES